jgi:hypothetical protein
LLRERGYIRVSKSRSRRSLAIAGLAVAGAGASGSPSASGNAIAFDSVPPESPESLEPHSAQFEHSSSSRAGAPDSRWKASQPSSVPAHLAPSNQPRGVGGLLRRVLGLKASRESASQAWGHSQQFAPSTQQDQAPSATVLDPPVSAAAVNPAPLLIAAESALAPEPAQLQAARELMTHFLHQRLPAIAHEASLSIEAMQTRDQVLSSLPDYSHLVSRTGDVGAAHLAQLHRTLGLVG